MFSLNNLIISSLFQTQTQKLKMDSIVITTAADQNLVINNQSNVIPDQNPQQTLSKNAQKKLLRQQKFEAKKAEKKAAIKEEKKRNGDRKRKEWEEKLASLSEDEKLKLIETRKEMRKERMGERNEEREKKVARLSDAKKHGQKIVVDLHFSQLMSPLEIHSLVKQITYCYSVNGRSVVPCCLWLTGYEGEIGSQIEKIPGFDKWIIEKDTRPYINTFETQKEDLVYLTADSENMLTELDLKKIYIIGGLVDRNRWKGITMKKAEEQGIQTAKLPIGNYLKMSSSQVLTVNQVIEILLKYLENKDWKESFFSVIPQRKRCETEGKEGSPEEAEEGETEKKEESPEEPEEDERQELKRQCIET